VGTMLTDIDVPAPPTWKISADAVVERERCLRVVDCAIKGALARDETLTVQWMMALRNQIERD
jgi:hypothetical protein